MILNLVATASQLLRYAPLVLNLLLYFLCCAYCLAIFNYGLQAFIAQNMITKPIVILQYLYNYTTWVFKQSTNLAPGVAFVVIASYLLPLALIRFFTNLYYFFALITTTSIKGWNVTTIFNATKELKNKQAGKQRISFITSLVQRFKKEGNKVVVANNAANVSTNSNMTANPNNAIPPNVSNSPTSNSPTSSNDATARATPIADMKKIAAGVQFARVESHQVDALKKYSMQREEPNKNVLGVGLKPK